MKGKDLLELAAARDAPGMSDQTERPPTSPLFELLGVRGDELKLLAWVVTYAPDGDLEAALQRAWAVETRPPRLRLAYRRGAPFDGKSFGDLTGAARAAHCTAYAAGDSGGDAPCSDGCKACADGIRSAVSCPTWADLTGEKA